MPTTGRSGREVPKLNTGCAANFQPFGTMTTDVTFGDGHVEVVTRSFRADRNNIFRIYESHLVADQANF